MGKAKTQEVRPIAAQLYEAAYRNRLQRKQELIKEWLPGWLEEIDQKVEAGYYSCVKKLDIVQVEVIRSPDIGLTATFLGRDAQAQAWYRVSWLPEGAECGDPPPALPPDVDPDRRWMPE